MIKEKFDLFPQMVDVIEVSVQSLYLETVFREVCTLHQAYTDR